MDNQLKEVQIHQTIITVDGKQRVLSFEKNIIKPKKQQQKEEWNYTISNVIPESKRPLLKNTPQHETFRYHPLQEPETYTCAASGYEIPCKGIKCKAHIITRKIKPTKSIGSNILIICKAHEKYFNDKPLKEWYLWVKKNYPDHFNSVNVIAKFVYEQLEEYLEVLDDSLDNI